MFVTYLKYFFRYILSVKSRQKLLILAIVGLFLSSFALIVLQSTMGGLQKSVIERSKKMLGHGTILYNAQTGDEELLILEKKLLEQKIQFTKEYQLELLVRYETFVTPIVVHGIDLNGYVPPQLDFSSYFDQKSDAIIPMELAYKIGIAPPEDVQLISPSHVDEFLGDIPRSVSVSVGKSFSSNVPEIDLYHMWVRLPVVQNLVRSNSINLIRLYSEFNSEKLKRILPTNATLKTWEAEHATLVWALNLESTVMIFLFASMSLLVSLCITSGLLIFFNKIKSDLASFWILGVSFKNIYKSTTIFLHLMSFLSIIVGIIFGIMFLTVFDYFAPDIMPDVFVDRKIPIDITFSGLLISFIVPYAISSLFIMFSLKQFKTETNLLEHVRTIN